MRLPRSSVQAELPTERAPPSSQRCLVNQRACWAVQAEQVSLVGGDRTGWIRLLLRASNEHCFIVRVLRAREMNQPALSIPRNEKACWLSPAGFFVTRQRPTFPLPHSSSIIGLGGLNFRVRYGNGCGPSGKATGNSAKREFSIMNVQC